VRTNQVGQIARATSSVETTTAALSGSGTIQVGTNQAVTIGASAQGALNGQTIGSAYAKARAINAASVPGLSAQASNNVEFGIATTATTGVVGTPVATALYSLRINGTDIFASFDATTGATLSAQQITDAINTQSSVTGVTASLTGANLRLSAADGRDIIIAQEHGTGSSGGISAGAGGATTINGVTYRDGTLDTAVANAGAFSTTAAAVNGGLVTLSAAENIIVTGDGQILGFAQTGFTIAKDTSTLASLDVKTVANANNTMQRIDAALTAVSSLRSTFGAIQNRFESTISNLTAVNENLEASRSRILDADFAAETATLTRAQILQQAGIAILAQANAAPQSVLALLQ
jgi:flagellin